MTRGHPTARFLNQLSAGKGTVPPPRRRLALALVGVTLQSLPASIVTGTMTTLQALTAVLIIADMIGLICVLDEVQRWRGARRGQHSPEGVT